MLHPGSLSIKDYTYSLPEDRIAKYPLQERDQSRLLCYRQSNIVEDRYHNLAAYLPANSTLVFNNTKVVEARLLFQKASNSVIEIFCLEPDDRYADITSAMLQQDRVWWKCLVGGAKKWKEGALVQIIQTVDGDIQLTALKQERVADYYIIELSWNQSALSFAEILHLAGQIPLPPYLNRSAEQADKERYQTVYAKFDGSVAAPTAGLHFTEAVFASLSEKNIHRQFVTLHVGAGTFKPVKSENMRDHEMHAEFIDVDASSIRAIMNALQNKIIAVGTTSLRTIESLYWLGVKASLHPFTAPDHLSLTQWEPYELAKFQVTATEAFNHLLKWMDHHQLSRLVTKTQIIIAPGYRFRVISALITNFHQPQSTLLLLVAALIGEDWKKVYQYALDHDFRFLSYGDGALLWSENE